MNTLFSHMKRNRIIYSYILTSLLICLFAVYLVRHKEALKVLSGISVKYVMWITLLGVIYKLILGLKFKIMINFFGIKLKPREWFGLSCVVSMINALFPAHAGTATQAVYLKKVYKFEYSKFIGYLLNFLIFSILVYSISGIFFLALEYSIYRIFYTTILLIFLAVLAGSLASIFLMPKFAQINFKWEIANRITKGFKAFKAKRSLVVRFIIMQALDIIITGLRLFLAYRALGAKVGVLPIMLVGILASLSTIVNLTPANLGIRELFITFSSVLVGEGMMFGVMASVIDRIIGTLITFVFGLISMYFLLPAADIKINKEKIAA